MGWTQKATKGSVGGTSKAPPGNHPAVLVALIDMGTQTVDGFNGGPSKEQHRAYFVWELVSELEAGTTNNHLIAIDLNVSLNEKAKLRKWIESRAGKPIPDGVEYDILKELGKPCLLSVILNKDGYPRIEGVAAVPKGTTVPKPKRELFSWSLDQFQESGEVAGIPDWIPWLFGRPITDHISECAEIKQGFPEDGKTDEAKQEEEVPF